MSDVVSDLMNTIDELNIKNNDLEKENADLKVKLDDAEEVLNTCLNQGDWCEDMHCFILAQINYLRSKAMSEVDNKGKS